MSTSVQHLCTEFSTYAPIYQLQLLTFVALRISQEGQASAFGGFRFLRVKFFAPHFARSSSRTNPVRVHKKVTNPFQAQPFLEALMHGCL